MKAQAKNSKGATRLTELKGERIATCRAAQPSLTARIADYKPAAIVTLLLSIGDIVESAATTAGSNAPRYAVPFPGMGQQGRFLVEMKKLIPSLPRVS